MSLALYVFSSLPVLAFPTPCRPPTDVPPARRPEATVTAVPAADLADAFARSAKRIRRASFHRLAPYGINPSQSRALETIARGGRTIRLSGLAERLRIAPRSATTVVDALEAAGLVTRTPDPDDRRATLLRLTAAGDAMLAEIARVREEVAAEYFAPLAAPERGELLRLLGTLDAAYDAAHPHGHHHGHGNPHGHDGTSGADGADRPDSPDAADGPDAAEDQARPHGADRGGRAER